MTLEEFKNKYKPREECTLHIGVTPEGKLIASVFKKVEIKDKKNRVDIAECSVFNISTKDSDEYVKALLPYIYEREVI